MPSVSSNTAWTPSSRVYCAPDVTASEALPSIETEAVPSSVQVSSGVNSPAGKMSPPLPGSLAQVKTEIVRVPWSTSACTSSVSGVTSVGSSSCASVDREPAPERKTASIRTAISRTNAVGTSATRRKNIPDFPPSMDRAVPLSWINRPCTDGTAGGVAERGGSITTAARPCPILAPYPPRMRERGSTVRQVETRRQTDAVPPALTRTPLSRFGRGVRGEGEAPLPQHCGRDWGWGPFPSPRMVWIEGVAQAVADEVDRQDGDGQRHAGDDREQRLGRVERARFVEHVAPGRRLRRHAEPEERKRRLGQDVLRDPERRRHDDRSDHVRQQVAHDDPAARHADRTRRLGELPLLEREEFATDDPCQPHPAEEPEEEDDVGNGDAVQHRRDDEQQENRREREHQVDEAHQRAVDPAAVVACDR